MNGRSACNSHSWLIPKHRIKSNGPALSISDCIFAVYSENFLETLPIYAEVDSGSLLTTLYIAATGDLFWH